MLWLSDMSNSIAALMAESMIAGSLSASARQELHPLDPTMSAAPRELLLIPERVENACAPHPNISTLPPSNVRNAWPTIFGILLNRYVSAHLTFKLRILLDGALALPLLFGMKTAKHVKPAQPIMSMTQIPRPAFAQLDWPTLIILANVCPAVLPLSGTPLPKLVLAALLD